MADPVGQFVLDTLVRPERHQRQAIAAANRRRYVILQVEDNLANVVSRLSRLRQLPISDDHDVNTTSANVDARARQRQNQSPCNWTG